MEHKLTFHSGEEVKLEEGGSLILARFVTETGGVRTVIQVPRNAEIPIPALTDRDVAVLCGLLLSFTFAPEKPTAPVLSLQEEHRHETAGN